MESAQVESRPEPKTEDPRQRHGRPRIPAGSRSGNAPSAKDADTAPAETSAKAPKPASPKADKSPANDGTADKGATTASEAAHARPNGPLSMPSRPRSPMPGK